MGLSNKVAMKGVKCNVCKCSQSPVLIELDLLKSIIWIKVLGQLHFIPAGAALVWKRVTELLANSFCAAFEFFVLNACLSCCGS